MERQSVGPTNQFPLLRESERSAVLLQTLHNDLLQGYHAKEVRDAYYLHVNRHRWKLTKSIVPADLKDVLNGDDICN